MRGQPVIASMNAKLLEKRITEIKKEMQMHADGSPEEVKKLEQKQEAMAELARIEDK